MSSLVCVCVGWEKSVPMPTFPLYQPIVLPAFFVSCRLTPEFRILYFQQCQCVGRVMFVAPLNILTSKFYIMGQLALVCILAANRDQKASIPITEISKWKCQYIFNGLKINEAQITWPHFLPYKDQDWLLFHLLMLVQILHPQTGLERILPYLPWISLYTPES